MFLYYILPFVRIIAQHIVKSKVNNNGFSIHVRFVSMAWWIPIYNEHILHSTLLSLDVRLQISDIFIQFRFIVIYWLLWYELLFSPAIIDGDNVAEVNLIPNPIRIVPNEMSRINLWCTSFQIEFIYLNGVPV